MALTNGPNLGLLVNGNAGEGHYTDLMKQWRGLDALVMPVVDAYLVNTPPVSPADGYTAIIGAAPTGLWAGQGGKLTRWSTVVNAYEFFTPKNGWTAQSKNAREVYRYTGGAWEVFYQEGTWTPTIKGSSTAGSNTYAGTGGGYTKIGRVYYTVSSIFMSAKDVAMAGNISIAGLPSTPTSDGTGNFGISFNFNAGVSTLFAAIISGTSEIYLLKSIGSSTTYVVAADIADNTVIRLAATYTT